MIFSWLNRLLRMDSYSEYLCRGPHYPCASFLGARPSLSQIGGAKRFVGYNLNSVWCVLSLLNSIA
jgi:hypothetical protein